VVSDGQRITLGQDNAFIFEVRTATRAQRPSVLQNFKNAAPVREARAFVARMPKKSRQYAFIGFLGGIPLSYFFQSPLVRKAFSLLEYVLYLPKILFEALFISKSLDQKMLEQFIAGDVVAVLFTVCIICALIGGFAGYYIDQSRRRR
jgi:hypothetical protein